MVSISSVILVGLIFNEGNNQVPQNNQDISTDNIIHLNYDSIELDNTQMNEKTDTELKIQMNTGALKKPVDKSNDPTIKHVEGTVVPEDIKKKNTYIDANKDYSSQGTSQITVKIMSSSQEGIRKTEKGDYVCGSCDNQGYAPGHNPSKKK